MSFLEEIGAQENDGTSLTKDSNKEKPDFCSAGVASRDQFDPAVTKTLPMKNLRKSNHQVMAPMGVIKIQKIMPIRTTQIWRMKQTV